MALLKALLVAKWLGPNQAASADHLNPLLLLPVLPIGFWLGGSISRQVLTMLARFGELQSLAPDEPGRGRRARLFAILFFGLVVRLGPACAASFGFLFPSLSGSIVLVEYLICGLALGLMTRTCHRYDPTNRLLCILLLLAMLIALRAWSRL